MSVMFSICSTACGTLGRGAHVHTHIYPSHLMAFFCVLDVSEKNSVFLCFIVTLMISSSLVLPRKDNEEFVEVQL